jgi:hypothetical protein
MDQRDGGRLSLELVQSPPYPLQRRLHRPAAVHHSITTTTTITLAKAAKDVSAMEMMEMLRVLFYPVVVQDQF